MTRLGDGAKPRLAPLPPTPAVGCEVVAGSKVASLGGSYSALIVGHSVRFWDSRVHMGDRNERVGILK